MFFLLIAGFSLFAACDSAPEPTSTTPSYDAAIALEILPLVTSEQAPSPFFPGDAATIASNTSITIAVREDGSIATTGSDRNRLRGAVEDWQDIVAVSSQHTTVAGLRSDGTVVVGRGVDNIRGEIVEDDRPLPDVSDWTGIVSINATAVGIYGLRSDGTVAVARQERRMDDDDDFWEERIMVWGEVESWYNVVFLAADNARVVGVKADGSVVAAQVTTWGVVDLDGWRDITAVSLGARGVVGLRSDGSVVSAVTHERRNRDGAYSVEDWRDIVAISTGGHHTLGLRADGTVVGTGREENLGVDGWSDIVSIHAGFFHSVGIRSDGTVVATGDSLGTGNLGVSDWSDIKVPTVFTVTLPDRPALPHPLETEELPEEPSAALLPTTENNIFARINELRAQSSQHALVRDSGLDRIASEYLSRIFSDAEARRGDFQTLPNGYRVISLAHMLDVTVTGFDYSVFLGFSIEEMEVTGEFISKAIEGDFTRIGVARRGESDGFSSMVVIVYDRGPADLGGDFAWCSGK